MTKHTADADTAATSPNGHLEDIMTQSFGEKVLWRHSGKKSWLQVLEMVRIRQMENFRACERLLAPFPKLSPIFRPPKQNTTNNHSTLKWSTEESCLGGAATGESSCSEGYSGPLCAVCEEGTILYDTRHAEI